MENPPNNDTAGLPATEGLNAAANLAAQAQNSADPDPHAPADPEEVAEQEDRLQDLTTLLGQVDAHVEQEFRKVLENEDDDTDPAYTSDAGQSSAEVQRAYELQAQAAQILKQDVVTNEGLAELEDVIDRLDSEIQEATPSSFDPNAAPVDDLPH